MGNVHKSIEVRWFPNKCLTCKAVLQKYLILYHRSRVERFPCRPLCLALLGGRAAGFYSSEYCRARRYLTTQYSLTHQGSCVSLISCLTVCVCVCSSVQNSERGRRLGSAVMSTSRSVVQTSRAVGEQQPIIITYLWFFMLASFPHTAGGETRAPDTPC